jgi:putative SOS response-associated peptidase YedK
MCGRYATTRSSADLADLFEAADETGESLAPDYNLAPTDPAPIVRMSERVGGRVVSVARWGLVPAWAKDARGAARMINARAETVATSSAFSRSFAARRCLIPADGWYEWARQEDGSKQAYFVTPADGSVLAFAGLWSVWGSGPDRLLSCSVITTAAVGDLTMVHDRMPLTLPRQRWAQWLGESGAVPEALFDPEVQFAPEILLAAPAPEWTSTLEVRPVGPAVGDVRNDGPGLIASVSVAGVRDRQNIDGDLTLF